jgi:hypothetical protein
MPVLWLGGFLALSGCSGGGDGDGSVAAEPQVLATIPLDDLSGLLDTDDELSFDSEESSDGAGSLHIDASKQRTVRLVEIPDPGVAGVRLTWTASLKTVSQYGGVYMELWAKIPGYGERFERGPDRRIGRTTVWTEVSTHLDLPPGESPEWIRLQLVLAGGGHVWVDAMRLTASPIPED